MILFLDDDAQCRNWLVHHHQGYALEGMRNRKSTRLILHRANCTELKEAIGLKRATTHQRWVGCSTTRGELTAWAAEEYQTPPLICEACLAAEPTPDEVPNDHHLTRLARDILDYVLDVAVMHLEPDAKAYQLTVGDVAHCLAKTGGQLAPALERLKDARLIEIEDVKRRRTDADHRVVRPTAEALRTLPYFAAWTPSDLESEVAKLQPSE